MKKLVAWMIMLSVILSFSLTAYAHDVPQERNDCSIEIIVRYCGESIDGGSLTAIKVGCVEEKDGNYFFEQVMTNELLDDIASAEATEKQKAFYDSNKKSYDFYTQTQTVKDGRAVFCNLSTGLYLIVQNEAADGFCELGAFLVGVPYMEDGEYQYHVTAASKCEMEREPTPVDPPPEATYDPELPLTGQLNWPIPLMTVVGLAFFIVGWMLCFGKKRV